MIPDENTKDLSSLQKAFVKWGDDHHLVSPFYGDGYFSRSGAIPESRYVFLQQNKLPHAWLFKKNFHIAETGFGTGLNFLLTLDLWKRFSPPSAHLAYTSVEKHPIPLSFLKNIHEAWPELNFFSEKLLSLYPSSFFTKGKCHLAFPELKVNLLLVLDDVSSLESYLDERVDAWFLDGFAPAKNPEMWQDTLFSLMGRKTAQQGTFATFTAASLVKRGLEKEGFFVEKYKGFAGKKDMLKGFFTGENRQKL